MADTETSIWPSVFVGLLPNRRKPQQSLEFVKSRLRYFHLEASEVTTGFTWESTEVIDGGHY